MANDVVFRRIHGRLVPIKINPPEHNKSKGSALVTAGISTGVAAGSASAHLHREAAHAENVAFGIRKIWRAGIADKAISAKTLSRTLRAAAKQKLESQRLHKAGKNIQKGGAAVGSALIGAGVHQALKDSKLSDSQKAAVATGSGLAAHFAIRSAYTKVLGKTKTWEAIKHAAKRVAARGIKL